MKTFHQFLKEGGNVKVNDTEASPIDTGTLGETGAANIKISLYQLHKDFERKTGKHLFGKDAKALRNNSTFSGSSMHLFDKNISREDLKKYKSHIGDIDVKVDKSVMPELKDFLAPGRTFGQYTVVGSKSGGGEIHTLARYSGDGKVHQIDFESSNYHEDEPHEFEKFSHSSDWEDVKKGFKGAHKSILLASSGLDKHKYSILYGLGSKADKNNPAWETDTKKITKTLFGDNADEKKLHSFAGITHLIKHHLPKEKHQEIYNKFVEATSKMKNVDSTKAVAHLKKELNTHD